MRKALLTLLIASPVFASEQPVKATGSYPIKDDAKQACAVAYANALEEAVKKTKGILVSTNRQSLCYENNKTSPRCTYEETNTSTVDGLVKEVISSTTRLENGYCFVDVVAKVGESELFAADITGKSAYSHGELMQFAFSLKKPAYLYVFNRWGDRLDMVYPVPHFEIKNFFNVGYFPPEGLFMTATLPKGKSTSEERLIFLFTYHKIDVNKAEWDIEELNDLIKSMPPANRKVVYRNIVITK